MKRLLFGTVSLPADWIGSINHYSVTSTGKCRFSGVQREIFRKPHRSLQKRS